MNILAATEGHLRARRVDSDEWNFDSFRILQPISPWNASKRSSGVCLSLSGGLLGGRALVILELWQLPMLV